MNYEEEHYTLSTVANRIYDGGSKSNTSSVIKNLLMNIEQQKLLEIRA